MHIFPHSLGEALAKFLFFSIVCCCNLLFYLGTHRDTSEDGLDILNSSIIECNGWLPHCTILLRPVNASDMLPGQEFNPLEIKYKNIDGNHRLRLLRSLYHLFLLFCVYFI